MNIIIQKHFLENPIFNLEAILKSINKIFEKQVQRNPFFMVDDSESISKILEKHRQRSLHFRKLFCIYK